MPQGKRKITASEEIEMQKVYSPKSKEIVPFIKAVDVRRYRESSSKN